MRKLTLFLGLVTSASGGIILRHIDRLHLVYADVPSLQVLHLNALWSRGMEEGFEYTKKTSSFVCHVYACLSINTLGQHHEP
jgi:hypothetical protein